MRPFPDEADLGEVHGFENLERAALGVWAADGS